MTGYLYGFSFQIVGGAERWWPPPPGPSSLCSSSLASGRLGGPPTCSLEVPWALSASVTGRCAPSEIPLLQLPKSHVSLPACGHFPLVPLQTPLNNVCAIAHCCPMFPTGRLRLKGQERGLEPRTGGSADSGPRREVPKAFSLMHTSSFQSGLASELRVLNPEDMEANKMGICLSRRPPPPRPRTRP